MGMPLVCAFMMGAVGGSRSMLAPAAMSRAARSGRLNLEGTQLGFMEGKNLSRVLMGLALAEIVADKLPMTPSRKAAAAYTARIVSGALAGAVVGASARRTTLGTLLGVAGAVVGTEGGAAFRSWLSSLFEHDLPAAVIEDMVTFALIGYASSKLKECASPA